MSRASAVPATAYPLPVSRASAVPRDPKAYPQAHAHAYPPAHAHGGSARAAQAARAAQPSAREAQRLCREGPCPCRVLRRWSRVAHDGARPAVALPAPSTGASRRLACLARVAAVKPALPSPHHSLSSLAADEVMDALARWTCGTASQSGPAHRLMSLILHL